MQLQQSHIIISLLLASLAKSGELQRWADAYQDENILAILPLFPRLDLLLICVAACT